ncbi:MAG TPA: hypothetical protein VFT43_08725 [Candidatus Polarisedimenticolia bacterium]|nr:hypothetical protein [Candidatus Polarisedimenticolia bacterium]
MRQLQLLMRLQQLLDGEIPEAGLEGDDLDALLDDYEALDQGLDGADDAAPADPDARLGAALRALVGAGRTARGGRGRDLESLRDILRRLGSGRGRGGREGRGALRDRPLLRILKTLGEGRRAGGGLGEIGRLLSGADAGEDAAAGERSRDPVVARRRKQILEFRTAWLEALGQQRRAGAATAASANPEAAGPTAPADPGRRPAPDRGHEPTAG